MSKTKWKNKVGFHVLYGDFFCSIQWIIKEVIQECMPIGCIPTASVAATVCLQSAVCASGVEGVHLNSTHHTPLTYPPPHKH